MDNLDNQSEKLFVGKEREVQEERGVQLELLQESEEVGPGLIGQVGVRHSGRSEQGVSGLELGFGVGSIIEVAVAEPHDETDPAQLGRPGIQAESRDLQAGQGRRGLGPGKRSRRRPGP